MRALKSLGLLVLPVVLLFGCSSTPEQPAAVKAPEVTKPKPEAPATTKPDAGAGTGSATAIDTSKEKADASADKSTGPGNLKNTVYFDFDRFDIKPEFREAVLAHAAYLTKNPSATVKIEGHCDERGTREYNIALGDRRATAVRQLLKLQGVSDKQIATISFGEERPVALGHDEDSWWQNRRAVFAYR
ncbi:MAG: peptidoglycan-associated lipoprotein Pal [Gammaproteobacteria bacterium]|nr:peptidoglycan-associated lipoprotein Pal [Gammaproteobacteria bacterium]